MCRLKKDGACSRSCAPNRCCCFLQVSVAPDGSKTFLPARVEYRQDLTSVQWRGHIRLVFEILSLSHPILVVVARVGQSYAAT